MWQFIQHSKPKIQNSKSHAEGISLAVTNTFTLTLSAAIVIAMTPDSIPEISSQANSRKFSEHVAIHSTFKTQKSKVKIQKVMQKASSWL